MEVTTPSLLTTVCDKRPLTLAVSCVASLNKSTLWRAQGLVTKWPAQPRAACTHPDDDALGRVRGDHPVLLGAGAGVRLERHDEQEVALVRVRLPLLAHVV